MHGLHVLLFAGKCDFFFLPRLHTCFNTSMIPHTLGGTCTRSSLIKIPSISRLCIRCVMTFCSITYIMHYLICTPKSDLEIKVIKLLWLLDTLMGQRQSSSDTGRTKHSVNALWVWQRRWTFGILVTFCQKATDLSQASLPTLLGWGHLKWGPFKVK